MHDFGKFGEKLGGVGSQVAGPRRRVHSDHKRIAVDPVWTDMRRHRLPYALGPSRKIWPSAAGGAVPICRLNCASDSLNSRVRPALAERPRRGGPAPAVPPLIVRASLGVPVGVLHDSPARPGAMADVEDIHDVARKSFRRIDGRGEQHLPFWKAFRKQSGSAVVELREDVVQ